MPRRSFRFLKPRITGRAFSDQPVRNYLQVFVELTSLVAGVSLVMSVVVLQASFKRYGVDFLTAASLEDVAIGGFRIFVAFFWFTFSLNGLWLLLLAWLLLRLAQIVAAALSIRASRRWSVPGLVAAILVLLALARALFLRSGYSVLDFLFDSLRGDCCVTAWPVELWPLSGQNMLGYLSADLLLAAPLVLLLLLLLGQGATRDALRLRRLGRGTRTTVLPFLFAGLAAPEVHARAMRFYDTAAGRVTTALPDLVQCRGEPVYLIWSGARSDLVSCRQANVFHRYLIVRGEGLSVAIGEQDFQRGTADILGARNNPREVNRPNILP